uniref:Uncharacterized protein n=1 Tax=Naja naja TaxID=35670 RepID=A0A8C7E2S8_NAJNA
RLCTYACPLSEALNRSSFLSEITHYAETRRDIIMLDSSVLVAGVVIGVVLFLSCVAILIGSLRKNQCFRHLQLWNICMVMCYTPRHRLVWKQWLAGLTPAMNVGSVGCGPDRLSWYWPGGGRNLTLTSEGRPPRLAGFLRLWTLATMMILTGTPSLDSLSGLPAYFMCYSWPIYCVCLLKYTVVVLSFRYEECVGPGAAQIYLPTEDPPPYSLIDPCQQNDVSINNHLEERGSTSTTMGRDSEGLVRIQDLHQPSTASSSPFPTETAPPYEAVVCEQNVPLPQVSLALLKSSADYHRTLFDRIA